MAGRSLDGEELLTPSEVASLFRVDPKTVTRWAKAGKLTSIRTLGGHRRFRAEEVYSLLQQTTGQRPASQVPIPQQSNARSNTIDLAGTRDTATR
jgi:excisionase family DNA binding protein